MTFSAIPKVFCYSDFFCYTIVTSLRIEFLWNLQNLVKNGQKNLLNCPKYTKKLDENRVEACCSFDTGCKGRLVKLLLFSHRRQAEVKATCSRLSIRFRVKRLIMNSRRPCPKDGHPLCVKVHGNLCTCNRQ